MKNIIHVAAAAIVNENGEVLITRRAEDAHQGGLWEFPGGKLEAGETVEQALVRELDEELGIQLRSFRPLIKVTHHYSDKSVMLDVWKVDDYNGTPTAQEGQPVRWHSIEQLDAAIFPAADVPIIQALNLPDKYMITGKFESLEQFTKHFSYAISRGIELIQLRLTSDWQFSSNENIAGEVIATATKLSQEADINLMFNVSGSIASLVEGKNIHLNSQSLALLDKRPDCKLLSASCHTVEELKKAESLGANFVVLSPVQFTNSHPDTEPLGWKKFSEMVSECNVPAYALGGVTSGDVEKAWMSGAQGIAAISALWNINR